jgi:hypothetical protein
MALRAVNRAGRKAQSITLPAPVGGWNTRDALAAMPPGDAQAIVNLFPSATSVDLRKGYDLQRTIVYSTGPSVDVETAAGFVRYGETSLWAVGKVEGLNRSVLEDVVAGTEVTWADSLSGMTSYVQFANSGGNYVCAVFPNSGATDTYYTYDGTTWVAQGGSVSGSSSFRTIAAFQNRLWFTKGTTDLNAYYLATQAITGAPTAFQLGGYATKGGGLFGIGTWTLDGGVGGTDDLIVFVTTNGQAIVYQGTDPSSAASWRLVGVFDLSRPIGPPFKYGADLLVPCEDGLFSMAEVLRGNTGTEFAISDKVRTAWQAAAAGAAYSVSNVTSAYSPKFNMIVVNFPTSAFVVTGRQTSQWFVMNTITKAWTLFTGLDAWAVDVMAGDIYFANVTSDLLRERDKRGVGDALRLQVRQRWQRRRSCDHGLLPAGVHVPRHAGNDEVRHRAPSLLGAGRHVHRRVRGRFELRQRDHDRHGLHQRTVTRERQLPAAPELPGRR